MSKVSKLIAMKSFFYEIKFYYVNDIKLTLKHFNLNHKGKKTELCIINFILKLKIIKNMK